MEDTQDRGTLPPIISVVGRAKVGKTTFLVKLISELTQRGYEIAVIKHTVHAFDFGQPGKDTHKHTQAGAKAVALASARELVLTRPLDTELEIDQVAAFELAPDQAGQALDARRDRLQPFAGDERILERVVDGSQLGHAGGRRLGR